MKQARPKWTREQMNAADWTPKQTAEALRQLEEHKPPTITDEQAAEALRQFEMRRPPEWDKTQTREALRRFEQQRPTGLTAADIETVRPSGS